MQENNFELTINEEEETQISAALKTLEDVLLPKLVVLEKSEKHDLLRMGDKSVAFVDKSLEIAKQDSTLLSTFVDINALEVDVAYYGHADPLYGDIDPPIRNWIKEFDSMTILPFFS